MSERSLTKYAVVSIAAALLTMGLKVGAWLVTGSVGLLSDALESSVNLVAALIMFLALRVAARPADESHQYGHEKVELFSAAAEGLMIVATAVVIAWSAIERLIHPRPLQDIGVGVVIGLAAAAVNLAVGLWLVRGGRQHRSPAVVADGKHLLTDVWTSIGVFAGITLVGLTGWDPLDPIVALLVGANIVVTGGGLLWRAGSDLMDPSLPAAERGAVQAVFARYEAEGVVFHALRTRTAGQRRFLEVHVLVPGWWTVARGHRLLETIEQDLRASVPHLTVQTHLEPVEDPASYEQDG